MCILKLHLQHLPDILLTACDDHFGPVSYRRGAAKMDAYCSQETRPLASRDSAPATSMRLPTSLLGRRRTRSEAEEARAARQRPQLAPPNTAMQSLANSGSSSPRTTLEPISASVSPPFASGRPLTQLLLCFSGSCSLPDQQRNAGGLPYVQDEESWWLNDGPHMPPRTAHLVPDSHS